MSRTIHIQVRAKHDLKDIIQYSAAQWGEQQAINYYQQLTAGITALADNPELGFTCDHITEGYRQLPIKQHHVFYKVTNTKIHIIRVLHKRRYKINQLLS